MQPIKVEKDRFQLSEHVSAEFTIFVPHDHTLEDILKDEYFGNVSGLCRPASMIKAIWEDMTRFVWLVVISSGPQWVRTELIIDKDLVQRRADAFPTPTPPEYTIKWRGPHLKFMIQRISDEAYISEESFDSRGQAATWLNEWLKAKNR